MSSNVEARSHPQRAPHPRRASLARPVFLLVVASVLVATFVSFVVTFSGPPPFEPPRSLFSIARMLNGAPGWPMPPGTPRRAEMRPGVPPDRPDPPHGLFGAAMPAPQRRTIEAQAPAPRDGEQPDPAAARRVAAVLGVPADRLVAYTWRGMRETFDAVSGSYTFGWRQEGAARARWAVVRSQRQPFFTRWHIRTLIAMLLAILLLSIPAWAITRALIRPLRRLAIAADQAGTGAPLPPLPGGSREVQDLARAVSTMHARLAGHAEARTAMLAGIAHDLGTPLSRLAFRVESLPEEARTRAAADIEEMRRMIGATLAFARDEAQGTSFVRLDLASLLDTLVQDLADAQQPVAIEAGPRAVVRGDPDALRRLFGNLIENAVRYGEHATLRWEIVEDSVEIRIDDRGAGIDPAMAERLFQPFVRGDPSRNRATGGTGLGLAIVRSIATAHGGAVTLANRDAGEARRPGSGARARVVLPLA